MKGLKRYDAFWSRLFGPWPATMKPSTVGSCEPPFPMKLLRARRGRASKRRRRSFHWQASGQRAGRGGTESSARCAAPVVPGVQEHEPLPRPSPAAGPGGRRDHEVPFLVSLVARVGEQVGPAPRRVQDAAGHEGFGLAREDPAPVLQVERDLLTEGGRREAEGVDKGDSEERDGRAVRESGEEGAEADGREAEAGAGPGPGEGGGGGGPEEDSAGELARGVVGAEAPAADEAAEVVRAPALEVQAPAVQHGDGPAAPPPEELCPPANCKGGAAHPEGLRRGEPRELLQDVVAVRPLDRAAVVHRDARQEVRRREAVAVGRQHEEAWLRVGPPGDGGDKVPQVFGAEERVGVDLEREVERVARGPLPRGVAAPASRAPGEAVS